MDYWIRMAFGMYVLYAAGRSIRKAAVQRGARGVFLPPLQVDGVGVGLPLAHGSHV